MGGKVNPCVVFVCVTVESPQDKIERHVKVMPGEDERQHIGTIKNQTESPSNCKTLYLSSYSRNAEKKTE